MDLLKSIHMNYENIIRKIFLSAITVETRAVACALCVRGGVLLKEAMLCS